jgi:hypothetical protein
MTVHDFQSRLERLQREIEQDEEIPTFDGGGGSGDDGGMEARVTKLEAIVEKTSDRLAKLEQDVAVIKSNYSTKADVADAKNSIIMWVVSAILLAQLLPALMKKFGL